MSDLIIPRKWTLHAHDKRVTFVKGPIESAEHVLMKAFLWALYLPQYPDLTVETYIGDRYKPDVVSRDLAGTPLFWGESGRVGEDKILSLCRRFPDTHFVIAKWSRRLDPVVEQVEKALKRRPHQAPFELLSFPPDSLERFIDADSQVRVTFDQITRVVIAPESGR